MPNNCNDSEDSLVTDMDLVEELGEAEEALQFILPSQQPNTIVKLNKQEEDALIRELESEAKGNDMHKELDEALMDRSTA